MITLPKKGDKDRKYVRIKVKDGTIRTLEFKIRPSKHADSGYDILQYIDVNGTGEGTWITEGYQDTEENAKHHLSILKEQTILDCLGFITNEYYYPAREERRNNQAKFMKGK